MLTLLLVLSVLLVIDAVRQERKIDQVRKSHNLKTFKENIH
jgi:hypothetical protein